MKLLFPGTGTAGAKLLPEGTLSEGQRRCSSLMIDDDAVILEATVGEDPGNMIREDTAMIASHIGGRMGKPETAEMFAGLGMIEAYDGLAMEF